MQFNAESGSFIMTEAEYHALDENYEGLCISCGQTKDGCEPDAENYECELCERTTVQGYMNLLADGKINIIEAKS